MSLPVPQPLKLLNTQEAAVLLRLSVRTMEGYRVGKTGPPYIKLGEGKCAKVVYKYEDLVAWVDSSPHGP